MSRMTDAIRQATSIYERARARLAKALGIKPKTIVVSSTTKQDREWRLLLYRARQHAASEEEQAADFHEDCGDR